MMNKTIILGVISSLISSIIFGTITHFLVIVNCNSKQIIVNILFSYIIPIVAFFIVSILIMALRRIKKDELLRTLKSRNSQALLWFPYNESKESWFPHKHFYFHGFMNSDGNMAIDLYVFCGECKCELLEKLTIFPWYTFYCVNCTKKYRSFISYLQLVNNALVLAKVAQRNHEKLK